MLTIETKGCLIGSRDNYLENRRRQASTALDLLFGCTTDTEARCALGIYLAGRAKLGVERGCLVTPPSSSGLPALLSSTVTGKRPLMNCSWRAIIASMRPGSSSRRYPHWP